jgi:hypothetical protein
MCVCCLASFLPCHICIFAYVAISSSTTLEISGGLVCGCGQTDQLMYLYYSPLT